MQQVVQFEKKLQGFLWLNFVLWVLDALVYDQSAGVMIHQGGYLIPWIELNGQDSNINYLQEQSFYNSRMAKSQSNPTFKYPT